MPEPHYVIIYRSSFTGEPNWHGIPRTWTATLRWLRWLRTDTPMTFASIVRVERVDVGRVAESGAESDDYTDYRYA